jgi:DNA-binding XRE family transcriptional regulator
MAERMKLKCARMRRNWTQKQAAEYVGVDERTYRMWERGMATPRPLVIQQLCSVFCMNAEELGLEVNPVSSKVPLSATSLVSMFLNQDLSMRLLTLAFSPHRSFDETQMQVGAILEEFDAMNTDPITRREALRRLAGLSMMSLTGMQQPTENILSQCAASIAACWELGRSKNAADLTFAFEGVSSYLPTLKTLVKHSSQYRKSAATLAAQAALLQVVLGWSLESLQAAMQYGRDAVLYSQESDDVVLQLSALKCLAWTYYYDPHRSKQALQTMDHAVSLLKQQRTNTPLYMHGNIYSTLALVQAKNAMPSDAAMREAVKTTFQDQQYAPFFLDSPVPVLIRNEAMASYHSGAYEKAMLGLSQIVDPNTFAAKQSLPERSRIEALNTMTLASLKCPRTDMEQTIHLWKAGVIGAAKLHSEQRYNEAVFNYSVMEALWSNEKRIQELRPLTMHW